MTIKQRLRRVELAESNCRTRSEKARAGLNSLKQNFRDAATPWRIVAVGAIAGFFVGRSGDGGGVASGVGAVVWKYVTARKQEALDETVAIKILRFGKHLDFAIRPVERRATRDAGN